MDVAVVAPDPARAAVRSALADLSVTVLPEQTGAGESDQPSESHAGATGGEIDSTLARAGFAVVVAPAGDDVFETASREFDRWVAVEVGGVGGHDIEALDASVTVFGSATGCYDCLRRRVAATRPAAAASQQAETRETGGEEGEPADQLPAGAEPVEFVGSDLAGVDPSALRHAGAVGGRQAVRSLRGESLGGRITELAGSERRFTPTPGCDCHEPPTGFERGYREVSLSDAVGRMEQAVDERVGLCVEVGERESFPLPYYVAMTADTTGFSDVRCGEFGGGVAADWNRAYAKSVGEAIERYCAGVYRERRLRTAPTAGVIDAVPVEEFVRPTGAEPVPDDRPIAWVDGVELATGEYAALPAGFVHFPPPTEFAPPITTGLGVGSSTDEALLAGLTEVIERDATVLSWYSTFEPLALAVETERFETLSKRARAESLSVTPLLCTHDVDVPVVAVAVHRKEEWPKFAMGSAAALDAREAAADALEEALQNWTELRGMGPERASEEGGAIGRYAEFPRETRAFVDADTAVPASDVGSVVPADERLDTVIERVMDAGLSPYAARLTTSDAAALGFEAVRVVVPSAQPLFTGEPYFGDRLSEVPPELGFEPRPDRAYHPFP